MRASRVFVRLAALFAAAGPAVAGPAPRAVVPGPFPSPLAGPVSVDPPLEVHSAWRWIAVLKQGRTECPEPLNGRWTIERLFEAEPGWPSPVEGVTPLGAFCVYETGRVAPEPPVFALGTAPRRWDRDFMATRTAGGALDTALAPQLVEQFARRAGGVTLPPMSGHAPVRLAIVDTAATRESGGENDREPGTSVHGFTLLNLAKDLVCDPAGMNCIADVTSRLALGWRCFDPEQRLPGCRNPDGGFYGFPSDVAKAVHREVRRWKTSGQPSLVLNLSLGWPSTHGGLEASLNDVPAPALAALSAVQHAVCEGALVVAAAGNRDGGPAPENGPLLPAAWEQRPPLDAPSCQALGVTPNALNFPPAAGTYRTLVTAVGGVQADDAPLFNARPGGEPRLVAFGDHAKGVSVLGTTPTLTGSSPATTVVASALAAARYYRPGTPPIDAPDVVYGLATPLGRTADFCQGAACAAVARTTVCSAAAAACATPGPACPAIPACPTPTVVSLAAADLGAFAPQLRDLGRITEAQPRVPECHGESLAAAPGAAPTDPCPHFQYFPATSPSAAGPETGLDACPNCTYEPTAGSVYVEITDALTGELTDPTLKCGDQTWNLDLTLTGGDEVLVEGVSCAGADPIQISFTVNGDSSSTSPVLVVEP
jgi:hypothetical protein